MPLTMFFPLQTGIRFQPARATTNQKDAVPGRPCPDALLEDEAEALQDMQRCIEQFHDDSRYTLLVLHEAWSNGQKAWINGLYNMHLCNMHLYSIHLYNMHSQHMSVQNNIVCGCALCHSVLTRHFKAV